MRLGVLLPIFGTVRSPEALTTLARKVESLGFESVWLSEHIVVPPELFDPYGDTYDCLSALGYLAGATQRVQLGTSVLILPLHEPVLLAKQAATLHELSRGRLRLGVGVGWCAEEFDLMGVDFRRRGTIMNEHLAVLRQLLSHDSTTPHPRLDGIPFAPHTSTHLPILIGGHAPPALRRAALTGDGWHGVWLEPDEIPSYVAATRGQCNRPGFEISLRIDFRIQAADGDPYHQQGLVGTSQEIAARLRAYQATGVDELVLDFMDRDTNQVPTLRVMMDQLERLRGEILPLIV